MEQKFYFRDGTVEGKLCNVCKTFSTSPSLLSVVTSPGRESSTQSCSATVNKLKLKLKKENKSQNLILKYIHLATAAKKRNVWGFRQWSSIYLFGKFDIFTIISVSTTLGKLQSNFATHGVANDNIRRIPAFGIDQITQIFSCIYHIMGRIQTFHLCWVPMIP